MLVTRKTLLKKLYALEKEHPETDQFCGMEVIENNNFIDPEKYIKISHDYYGPYANGDTWNCIESLHKLLNKYTNIKYESRGSYTATLISFKK